MPTDPNLGRAYVLATEHRTHPNPAVGCVVVSPEGEILATGSHLGPGSPHAEFVALDQLASAQDCTVYVSLEPCSHHGRTPPCAERLISEGVARVVVGTVDPDERVSGQGIARLRNAGIVVEVVNDPAAREVDPGYFHHRETGMPLVTAKWAMTIDGNVAAADGSSRWISSEQSRMDVHRVRSRADGVVVGAGTVRRDDPSLDVRLDGYEGHQPRPVVIAGTHPLPTGARILARNPLIVTTKDLQIEGGEQLRVDGADGRPDPIETCRALGELGLLELLVEGGPTLAGAWWNAGVIDRGVVYVAGRIGGGAGIPPMRGVFDSIAEADDIEVGLVEKLGGDVRIMFNRKA